jgi:valyl-tRNA synthetase
MVIAQAAVAFEVVTQVRNIRNSKGISPKTAFDLHIKTTKQDVYTQFADTIGKLANVSSMGFVEEKVEGAISFIIKGDEFFVPMEGELDLDKEMEKVEKELEYTKGFRDSVDKKLANERFVSNAPEKVLAIERQKKADAEAKVKVLEETLLKLQEMQQRKG